MKPETFAQFANSDSETFKRANPDLFPASARSPAKLERVDNGKPLAARKEKGPSSGKFLVRVVSCRKRLLDEDNLCEKLHVDCLRYSGVLPSDDPATTRIETTQRKVAKGEAEHVLIEVFRLQ